MHTRACFTTMTRNRARRHTFVLKFLSIGSERRSFFTTSARKPPKSFQFNLQPNFSLTQKIPGLSHLCDTSCLTSKKIMLLFKSRVEMCWQGFRMLCQKSVLSKTALTNRWARTTDPFLTEIAKADRGSTALKRCQSNQMCQAKKMNKNRVRHMNVFIIRADDNLPEFFTKCRV